MSVEFNWPEKGDKPFVSSRDGAFFHLPSTRGIFPPHATAFKEAAEIILDKCEIEDRPSNDIFVFPVMYLYRHGIELNLKAIISAGVAVEFLRIEDVQEDLNRHNLARLWTHAKKALVQRWPGPATEPDPLKATESIINELHRSDPNGQVFRYATDKDGTPYLHESLPEFLSIANLKKKMDGVFNFLEVTWSALENDYQHLAQMRAEMPRENYWD